MKKFTFVLVAVAVAAAITYSAARMRAAQSALRRAEFVAAVRNGKTDDVTRLLEQKADPNEKILEYVETTPASSALETYPLIIAAQQGDEDIVKALLSHAADPNKLVNEGRLACSEGTALITAAGNGYDNVVGILLESGADPDLRTKCKVSALMAAAEKGHVAVMSSLLRNGASVDARNNVNSSALDAAAAGGSAAAVKFLLDNGAGKGPDEKERVLMNAVSNSKLEIAKVLVKSGADVNAELDFGPDGDPRTPLALAAYVGNVDMVKMLLSQGALRTKKDKAGNLPLNYAKAPGIVKLLGGGK